MDKCEIRSNASSDCPSSNLSCLSGITGFEDEFYDLKSVIRDAPESVCTRSKLNEQLQTCLKQNVKYKNDLYNLERQVESSSNEKFQKLSSYNSQLEARLDVANQRIAELSQAQVAVATLHAEIKRWKNACDQLECVNSKLKLNWEESKIDAASRHNSVLALKGKIVDLHVELQAFTLSNIKLNNELNVLQNNFNSCKKSEVWFKEQLHLCREQKLHLMEKSSRLQSSLIVKERDFNARNNDFLRLNTVLEEVQAAYNRSKCDPVDVDGYENTIATLSGELAALKEAVDAQQAAFEIVTKQNCELLHCNDCLENDVREKQTLVFNLTNDKQDLANTLLVCNAKLGDLSQLTVKLGKEKSDLEIALNAAKHQNADVEDVVATIRNDFAKFAHLYSQVKVELIASDRRRKQLEEALESTNEKLSANIRSEANSSKNLEADLKREINKSAELNQQLHHQRRELVRLNARLVQIEGKCEQLDAQIIADEVLLQEIITERTTTYSDSEDLRRLKALSQAKDFEIKEKQRRYETNHRTLLRKVKEHIRGRNAAEKRCAHLQELHDNIFNELNSCKLQQAIDQQSLRNELGDNTLQKFRDHEIVLSKTRLDLDLLRNENEALVEKTKEMSVELAKLEASLERESQSKRELYEKWLNEQQRNLRCVMQLDQATGRLQQMKVENELISDEVASVTMKLTCHASELTELREQKIFLETKRKLEEIIISNLKSDIQILQNDLASVKSDKYFLQRLCNDLKFALTTLRNQNEVLKQQITKLDSRDPLPDIQEIPSPCKYDEAFINELLKQSVTPIDEKPLCDLHNSLTLLKNEMISLRKQVISYNI